VIASDRPSLPEICGDAGLYVNPEKPAEIATAIARLRSEPGLRDYLKRKGFEQAGKYDWDKTAKAILALFNS
jgi:glycosyltransferase involved in cell wall biosynthesis